MRSLVAYLLALLAVAAGVWFGFFAQNEVEGKESEPHASGDGE